MAETKRQTRRPGASTSGNVAYKLDYYGDVVAAPKSRIEPMRRKTAGVVPQGTPTVNQRPHERTRVRVKVRQQQAVAPLAILGFLAAAVAAVLLLVGYTQLNSVYSETVKLNSQLTQLKSDEADLQATYAKVFDMPTLEAAVADQSNLVKATGDQTVYLDLSEEDNAVVYSENQTPTGLAGIFHTVGEAIATAVEFFR